MIVWFEKLNIRIFYIISKIITNELVRLGYVRTGRRRRFARSGGRSQEWAQKKQVSQLQRFNNHLPTKRKAKHLFVDVL